LVRGIRVENDGLYQVTSIPMMTPLLGLGDLVETFPDGNGGLELILVVKESDYSVFSLLPGSEDKMAIYELLNEHYINLKDDAKQFQWNFHDNGMFSIAALPSCFDNVVSFLMVGERQGRWCYATLANRANLADTDPRWDGI